MKHETAIPVGSGGMGEVFKAWDPDLERYVALKYLHHDDPVLVERLMREARAQARVDHPSVGKVYEVGEDEGRPYIAMEFVEGKPLDVAATDLTTEQKVLLVRKITEAIQAAHAAGLVHRDLKPANILVVDHDGEPHPYVLDFGIARMEEVAGLTNTGQVIGTPGYLSPEQARGDLRAIDRRTDVFSLGVILYELLSETRPFTGESQVEILLNLMEADPPSLRTVAPQVSRDLETIVMTCLEKNPERRYPSARALADDLGRFLEGEPVEARPVGLTERLVRKARKNPMTAVAVTLAGVALLALAVGGIGGWAKYTSDLKIERDIAEAKAAEAREITNFMIEVISYADPDESDGREITAREILEKGAKKIENELGDRPEIQARLYGIMGEVFARLGQFERSMPLLERSLALTESIESPLPEMVVEARVRLGDLCRNLDQIDRAMDVLAPVPGFVADHPELDPKYSVQGLSSFGYAQLAAGDLAAATESVFEALKLAENSLAPDDPVVADMLNNVTYILSEQKRTAEAIDYGRRAVEARTRAYGPDDPRVATALNNLGLALTDDGRYKEAAEVGEKVLEMRRRLLGNQHPRVASALNNLGKAYKKLGNLDRAEQLYLESIEIRRKIYGEDHPKLGTPLNNLGFVYVDRGQLDRAETTFRQCIEIYETTLGPDHLALTSPLSGLAWVLALQERFAEAETESLRQIEIREKAYGPESPTLVSSFIELADHHEGAGNLESATAALERARSIAVAAEGEKSDVVTKIDKRLAELSAGLTPGG